MALQTGTVLEALRVLDLLVHDREKVTPDEAAWALAIMRDLKDAWIERRVRVADLADHLARARQGCRP